MISKTFVAAACACALCAATPAYARNKPAAKKPAPAAEAPASGAQQELSDFSIDYGERGKKNWDLAGKSANVFNDVVKLNNITGNLYGPTEKVTLTAKNGDFDKAGGKVHLQDEVVITTTSGAKLTTDSLDWDSKKQLVSTKDKVNIEKDNMTTVGTGAQGEPNLNKMTLQKDVQVKIGPAPASAPEKAGVNQLLISCDGPLEINYLGNVATFKNNVKADRQDSVIYCDTMEVHFTREPGQKPDALQPAGGETPAGKIKKIVCRGNVRIVKGENVSYSEEAVYSSDDQKIMLTGRPRLVITSMDDMKSFGPQ